MKMLDELMKARAFERETSFTKFVALALQPQSYTDFSRHGEFDEVFACWTRGDNYRGLDVARIWAIILNCKHALKFHPAGAIAELGVYKG